MKDYVKKKLGPLDKMSLLSRFKNNTSSRKTTVDKDLRQIVQLEKASARVSQRYLNMGFGFLFLLAVWIFAYFHTGGVEVYSIVTVAALIGAYMAMNIGANDVANNVAHNSSC